MSSILYLLLIVALSMFSWVANVYGLMLPDGSLVPSVLSEEGVRWFVRHSVEHVSAAPLAQVLLVLMAVGTLRSSGLWVVWRNGRLMQRQRHALWVVLALLVVCMALLVMGLLPGGNLLSVTGHVSGGPLASGWLFLLSVIVVASSVVYGLMCGQWHGGTDILQGLASGVGAYASYFVTLVVASQLVAVVQYVHLFSLLGLSLGVQNLVVGLVYALPLILLIINNESSYDTSSSQ